VPGSGLAEKWKLREIESVSSYRLKLKQDEVMQMNVSEDVRKLLKDFGVSGSKYFPIRLKSGNILWGAERFAKIESPDSDPLGWFHIDYPTIVQKAIGDGILIYCGTNRGEGSVKNKNGFMEIFNRLTKLAGIIPNLNYTGPANAIRVDPLFKNDRLEFFVVRNNLNENQKIRIDTDKTFKGLFSQNKILPDTYNEVPIAFCDIFYSE
jgi:hypothetical protein